MTDRSLIRLSHMLTDMLTGLDTSSMLIIVVSMGSRLPGHPGSIEDIG